MQLVSSVHYGDHLFNPMLLLRHKTRKIVFRSLVVLYFFAATWLLLFANGYRIKFSPFTISGTGNVHASFKPTNADVLIDGITVGASSPTRARALFPGTHHVRIRADGYLSYDRVIRIEPHETTFVNSIQLVRDSTPVFVATSTATEGMPEKKSEPMLNGDRVWISGGGTTGTRVIRGMTPITRDLGAGAWSIAAVTESTVALARLDTGEIQFRSWNTPDHIEATLPGHAAVTTEDTGSPAIIALSTFELWQYETREKKASLIYRFSKPIATVIPVHDTTLVLVALADELVAFNVTDSHHIPLVLTTGMELSNVTVDEEKKSARFTTRIDGRTKIFERALY